MDESTYSYSPSVHSDSQDNPELEVSFMSTRSHCSQMSISSQGSAKDITDVVVRKHKTKSGKLSRRKHLGRFAKTSATTKKRSSPVVPTSSQFVPATETPLPVASSETNVVMSIGTIQSILNSMARCALCESGKLRIRVTGISHGTDSFLSIDCSNCASDNTFWSSGSRHRGTLTLGETAIKNRSQLIYASVLAGRIMGIGWAKLHLYHSFMNIPGAISKRSFTLAQADILVLARIVADESMKMATMS